MTLSGVHFFLVKLISRNVTGSTIALFNQLVIVVALCFYIYFTGNHFLPEENIYLGLTFLASLLLAIGVLTLYMAIQKGPLSIVMPIFSLNAVVAAILGILILEEAITFEKILGLISAVVAIILLRRS